MNVCEVGPHGPNDSQGCSNLKLEISDHSDLAVCSGCKLEKYIREGKGKI